MLMNTKIVNGISTPTRTWPRPCLPIKALGVLALLLSMLIAPAALASEAELRVPNLGDPTQSFMGLRGDHLLMFGLGVCLLGLVFGMVIYKQLKNLPVHRSMLEISDLIYETCKTYLITQGKFLVLLWVF